MIIFLRWVIRISFWALIGLFPFCFIYIIFSYLFSFHFFLSIKIIFWSYLAFIVFIVLLFILLCILNRSKPWEESEKLDL